ncbi:MAG TPA: hypothetical protein VFR23_20105 [Jiangellaceae bacterium]|nr:hypothetical protein [Jiangellaceae bacterium]
MQIRGGGLGWPEAESDDADSKLGWPDAGKDGASGGFSSPGGQAEVEETGETNDGR